MTYEQLLNYYKQSHPGVDVSSKEGQDTFNAWTGEVQAKTGATNWETIPSNAFIDPKYNLTITPEPLGLGSLTGAINNAAQSGAQRADAGGNLSQVQVGQQQGQFETNGSTNQSQTQAQTGTTSNNMTGNQNTTGTSNTATTGSNTQNTTGTTDQTQSNQQTQTGNTTGQTQSTGTTSTNVKDTLGLGSLVAGQASSIGASDAARTGFLTDTMQNGGTAFKEQVAQATNRALSGPGMQGTGNMAQGRVVGAAVGDVARNDQAARLNAAQQLAGPTGAVTAANQTGAFLGSEGTNTGSSVTAQQSQQLLDGISKLSGSNTSNTTGTNTSNSSSDTSQNTNTNQASTGTSSNLGISQLVGSESNKGVSSAQSGQVATGQVPENTQTSSGGGCYVCTAYHSLGKPLSRSITDAVKFKLANRKTYGLSLLAYSVYGPHLARAVLRNRIFRTVFKPIAMAVLYEELRLSGRVRVRKPLATLAHAGFNYAGAVLGSLVWLSGRRDIYTAQKDIIALLNKHNLYFLT